ncbi:DUF2922 domain-containing protein [Alkalibacillus almallahensis]|uniref:DUF2922 domain-containing protein n=1 Tax=Alkalibacillus almallahensis TaxID=1379154 RepID=UPI00141F8CA6|nr:DUF2922 domain-containing protein [Alkalibacillus almallahensis]NIK13317.1 hypothetical protein [Alkalibacillus almallahensis]
MSKRLELKFRNEEGRMATVSIDNPKDPVDPTEVKQAMDTIIAEGIMTSGGSTITAIEYAQVVERHVNQVPLDEA